MKKLTIATFFCALSFVGISQLDATLAPVGLLWGDLSLTADYCLSDNVSAECSAGFGGRSIDDTIIGEYTYRNLNIQGSVKYYFNPSNGCDELYAGGFIRAINRSYDYTNTSSTDYSNSRIGAGVLVGTKKVSDSGFVFDINLGIGRALYDNVTINDDDTAIAWPDIMFVGKLGLGYRFGR